MDRASSIERSHIRLLQRHNVDLSNINNTNIAEVLNSLKTKHGNKEITNNYKASILRTIKKLQAERYNAQRDLGELVSVSPARIRIKRKVNRSYRFKSEIYESIINAVTYVYNFNVNIVAVPSQSFLDTIIAILLLTSTSIKSNLLKKMQYRHFRDLYTQMSTDTPYLPIIIENVRVAIVNLDLFTRAFNIIEEIRRFRRTELNTAQLERTENLLFFSKENYDLNKNFRKIYIIVNKRSPPTYLGLSTFDIYHDRTSIANLILPNLVFN